MFKQYVIALVFIGLAFYLGRLSVSNDAQNTAMIKPQVEQQVPQSASSLKQDNLQVAEASDEVTAVNSTEITPEIMQAAIDEVTSSYNEMLQEQATENFGLNRRLSEAYDKMREAGLEVPTEVVSTERIEERLEAPFSDIIANSDTMVLEEYSEFDKQQKDQQWALAMETSINDAFALHPLAYDIDLQSVECRESRCEIYGFERGNVPHRAVEEEIIKQDWYLSNAPNGGFSTNGDRPVNTESQDYEFDKFFYIMYSFARN